MMLYLAPFQTVGPEHCLWLQLVLHHMAQMFMLIAMWFVVVDSNKALQIATFSVMYLIRWDESSVFESITQRSEVLCFANL